MKIIHRYLLSVHLKNLALSLFAFTALFLVVDIFDRLENILPEDASFLLVAEYFLLKIPGIASLMLPVSMLVATLFTIGMLSKHSEITAMRASGLTVFWIAKPLFYVGGIASLCAILLNETVVPFATRRAKEIYNIDIQKKHDSGSYSQSNFWWRSGNTLYSVGAFDSRTNTLYNLNRFDITDTFDVMRRLHTREVQYLTKGLGWSMKGIHEYRFNGDNLQVVRPQSPAPLPLSSEPQDFYEVRTDPYSMSYRQLRKFIRTQSANGVDTSSYLPDLYEKLSSPFLLLVIIPVVLPFALKPARTGSLAVSFLAGLVIGFSYYAVHSLSLALGRGDIWPPLLAAWMANIVLSLVGTVLMMGTEAPS
jgi:lipopolysaccharide export system permease protein